MPWISLLGNDIHYTDQGHGDPVVLIHGRGSTKACWEPIQEELSKTNRVLAYDSYDHGFSSNSARTAGTVVDRADELEAFIDALELENFSLMGQSMGSMTVLRWAARNPDTAKALVFCGMGWPLVVPPEGDEVATQLDPEENIWVGVGNSFTPGWIQDNPVEYQRYIRVRSTATAIEATRHPRDINASQGEFFSQDPEVQQQFESRIRGIKSPALFFAGDREAPFIYAGIENAHTLIEHSRLVVVKDAAHNAYYQEYPTLISEFQALLSNTKV